MAKDNWSKMIDDIERQIASLRKQNINFPNLINESIEFYLSLHAQFPI